MGSSLQFSKSLRAITATCTLQMRKYKHIDIRLPVNLAPEAALAGCMEEWSGHHQEPLLEGTLDTQNLGSIHIHGGETQGRRWRKKQGARSPKVPASCDPLEIWGKAAPSLPLPPSYLTCEPWVSSHSSERYGEASKPTRGKASPRADSGKRAVRSRPHSGPRNTPVSPAGA